MTSKTPKSEPNNLLLIDREQDQLLFSKLAQLPGPTIPSDFVQRTTGRFEQTRALRMWRKMGIVAAATILLVSPVIWLVLLNFKAVAMACASMFAAMGTLLQVTITMWSWAPIVSMATMIGLMCAVILPMVMLMYLSKWNTGGEIKTAGVRI